MAGVLYTPQTGLNVTTNAAIGLVSVVMYFITFLMTSYRSVDTSQVLSISKSPSLRVELGKEMEKIESEFRPKSKNLTLKLLKLIKSIENFKFKKSSTKKSLVNREFSSMINTIGGPYGFSTGVLGINIF
jgi:hypothetical protein